MKQLRKRFNEERVKELLKKYEDSAVKLEIICDIVGVARTQFFCLLKQYRQNKLSLSYKRTSINQSLEKEYNNLILYGLKERFKLIQDNKIPIYRYNYSYAQQTILRSLYSTTAAIIYLLLTPMLNRVGFLVTNLIELENNITK